MMEVTTAARRLCLAAPVPLSPVPAPAPTQYPMTASAVGSTSG